MIDQTKTDSFTEFVTNVESKLRHALTASFGVEHGREALAEAFAYAWKHWDRIQGAVTLVPTLGLAGSIRGMWIIHVGSQVPPPGR